MRAAIEHERAQLASGTCHRLLDVVPQSRLDQLIAAHVGAHLQRLFAPGVTLGLFVEQTLRADPACQDAVARYVSQRNAAGLSAAGLGTGSYCKALQRLPLALIEACAAEVAVRAEDALPTEARWRGRRIWLIDGTEVSMPDTPTLQDTFPQSRSQAAGVGFPRARIVGVVSLGSGCVGHWSLGPCSGKRTGECSQLWGLLDRFTPGDIVIADRAYGSYWLLAALQQRGVDFVIREHGARKTASTPGSRLGANDRRLVWARPIRPAWMDTATYEALNDTMSVREVTDGARRIVTSLNDPASVSAHEIAWLYSQRWQIELDFRSIKCAMSMDVLRCKSPEMVRKEIAATLLAYNLIRATMGEAVGAKRVVLRQLSFAAARRATAQYQDTARHAGCIRICSQARTRMLQYIAYWRIPERPGRIEPRAVKRRPKPRDLLTEPRRHARARIAKQNAALRQSMA